MMFMTVILFLCLEMTQQAHTNNGKLQTSSAVGSRPNIVLIQADDVGIGDIGCFGNTTLPTPNIDSLARDGAKLTQFLTAAAVCTPSRAALLTGRYPIRTGLSGVQKNVAIVYTASISGLPREEITIAELLKEAGYTNALIGKCHLGLHRGWVGDNYYNPLKHGFDYFFGIPNTNMRDFDDTEKRILQEISPNIHLSANRTTLIGILVAALLWKMKFLGSWTCLVMALVFTIVPQYPILVWNNMKVWNSMFYRNNDLVEQPIHFEKLTRRLVAECVEFLEAQVEDKSPFFLFFNPLQTHTVLHAGPEFQGKSKHGAYGDEVMELDWSVGQVLKALDRLGMRDDTLVMFTSDHGGHVEEHGKGGDRQGGHNGIYRGGKFQGGMDGGIRVPTVVRWPGHVTPGSQIDVPISNMDILPTLADASGLQSPGDHTVDGVSILPILTGERVEVVGRDYLIHYCTDYIHAVRFMPDQEGAVWKVRYTTPKWLPGTEGCKYICHCSDQFHTYHDTPLVFDMTSDPTESQPLAQSDSRAVALIQAAKEAIQRHQSQIEEDQSHEPWNEHPQLTTYNNVLRPWLMPCCNFPFCSCRDTKKYTFKDQ